MDPGDEEEEISNQVRLTSKGIFGKNKVDNNDSWVKKYLKVCETKWRREINSYR